MKSKNCERRPKKKWVILVLLFLVGWFVGVSLAIAIASVKSIGLKDSKPENMKPTMTSKKARERERERERETTLMRGTEIKILNRTKQCGRHRERKREK